jgi:hypothetical protein
MTFFRHTASGPGAAGDLWVTTMSSNGSGTLAATHTAWQTFVTSFMTSAFQALLPTTTQITDLRTDQLDAVTGKNAAQTKSGVSLAGSAATGQMSPRDCTVIGLRTALPTRAGRGRMFWPGVAAARLSSTGLISTVDATSIVNGFSTALTTFKATATPVILHKKIHPLTFELVTYVTVGNVLGTQRRRTNKVTQAYATHTV